jgi:hypothetical protein
MLNRSFFYTILIIFTIFTGIASGESGRITNLDDEGNSRYIVVKVRGEGTLWVSCAVYPAGHGKYEVDLEPVEVHDSGEAKFNLLSKISLGKTSIDYVVELWEDKIGLRKCEKKYGKDSENCKWAIKNGYKMEGRLDRREGTYRPKFD